MTPPTKKLFSVTVEFEMIVLAEDRQEAEELGDQYYRDVYDPVVSAREIKDPRRIPSDWKDSFPFDDGDNCETVGEIAARLFAPPPAPPVPDPNQITLGL